MPGNVNVFCSLDGSEEGRLAQSFEHARPAREKSSISISVGQGFVQGSVVSTVTPQWSEMGSVMLTSLTRSGRVQAYRSIVLLLWKARSMPASVYSCVARKRKFSTLSLRSAVENGSFPSGCQGGHVSFHEGLSFWLPRWSRRIPRGSFFCFLALSLLGWWFWSSFWFWLRAWDFFQQKEGKLSLFVQLRPFLPVLRELFVQLVDLLCPEESQDKLHSFSVVVRSLELKTSWVFLSFTKSMRKGGGGVVKGVR